MDKLQILKAWLEGFPRWGEADWEVDLTGCAAVSCRLTLEDHRVTARKENVLGIRLLTMQVQFSFIRVSYGEENPAGWVEAFSNWVTEQSEYGNAPKLGDGITRFRPEKGKLESAGDKAVYTVKLIGTYNKKYEVNQLC